MKAQRTPGKSKFMTKWVIINALALLFGLIFSFTITGFISNGIGSHMDKALAHAIGYSFLGAGTGAFVGFFQWRMLRKRIPVSASWILASAGGLFISELVVGLALWLIGSDRDLVQESQSILIYTLIYAVGGTIVGIFQRSSLENVSSKSNLWIYACSMGWGITILIIQIGFGMDKPLPVISTFLFGILALGLITGLFLVKIVGNDNLTIRVKTNVENPEMPE